MSRVEQQRNIIDYTLSSLLRRPFKNSLLILVYTLIIFSLGSVLLFTRAIRKEASILLREAPDMIVQRIVAGRHDLIPLSYLDTIASIEGTAAVRERLWGYYFDSAKGANYTLIVPATCGLRPGEVAIGVGVAAVRNVYKGEKLFFKAYNGEVISLRIRGILAPGSELIAADLIYICGDDFRKVFGVPEGYATDLVLKAVNREDVKAIASKVSIALPDTRSITQDEILGIYDT
ncbi:MAG: ABC transporter permease, partial [Syntrophobacteraceae bacterium]